MKRTPRYKSGPKKGQFKPRHAARAAAPRKKAKRRAARAAAAAPRRQRKSGTRRRAREAAAPRRRGSRRASSRRAPRGGSTIVIARDSGMAPRRASRRRHRFHARAPFVGTLGGMVVFGGGLIVGWELADFIDRKVVTLAKDGKLPEGIDSSITTVDQYNQLVIAAKPNWTSVAIRVGIGLAGIAGGIWLKPNILKALSYGIGFGAVTHVGAQVVTAYIIEPMFAKSDTGAQLYAHETNAQNMLNPPKKDGTSSGPPQLTDRRDRGALPITQATRTYPHPLASMMGAPANATSTPGGMVAAMQALATQPDPGFAPPANNGGGSGFTVQPPARVDVQAPPPAKKDPGGQPPPGTSTTCGTSCGGECDTCKRRGMGDPPPVTRLSHPLAIRAQSMRRLVPLARAS